MARLGLHIKLAEQALIAAKTEALKPFGLPVAHAKVLLTSLTKEGEELVLQADEHARAVEQRLLDEFTQAEQEQLKDLLTRARELLRTQPKRPPTP